jgi:hypothetical protein
MRISICPIVAALTGGNIGQLADVFPLSMLWPADLVLQCWAPTMDDAMTGGSIVMLR